MVSETSETLTVSETSERPTMSETAETPVTIPVQAVSLLDEIALGFANTSLA